MTGLNLSNVLHWKGKCMTCFDPSYIFSTVAENIFSGEHMVGQNVSKL